MRLGFHLCLAFSGVSKQYRLKSKTTTVKLIAFFDIDYFLFEMPLKLITNIRCNGSIDLSNSSSFYSQIVHFQILEKIVRYSTSSFKSPIQ